MARRVSSERAWIATALAGAGRRFDDQRSTLVAANADAARTAYATLSARGPSAARVVVTNLSEGVRRRAR